MGIIPKVEYKDIPSDCIARTGAGLILPEEIGIAHFDLTGKVQSLIWMGELAEAAGATTMDLDPQYGLIAMYDACGSREQVPLVLPPVRMMHQMGSLARQVPCLIM